MLDGLAVLDLTDHRGEIGPWLLAELGADVIKVEPPGGTSARRSGPMFQGGSLQFAAYNIGKRSVTLDPESAEDRAALRRLLGHARVVFDSGPPGLLAAFGVDRQKLAEVNPDVISVLITPFGSDGPRANDPASELTVAALGGPVRIQGSPERPPVKASVPQVWRHAGAEAALAALIAHHRTGPGTAGSSVADGPQFIDVSAQSAMTWTMLNAMEAHAIQGYDFERTGATLNLAMTVPLRRKCADGYVILVPRGLNAGKLVGWMVEEDVVDPSWADEDWSTYDHRLIDGQDMAIAHPDVIDAFDRLCLPFTKRELLERGSALGVTIAPVNNVADLRSFDHLEARSFWRTLAIDPEDQVLGLFGDSDDEVQIPGSFLTVNGNRPTGDRLLGPQVDSTASFGNGPADQQPEPSADPKNDDKPDLGEKPTFWIGSTGSLPLEGLKVADFSWVGVGPITAKSLADHGATVVRVESINRPDPLRSQLPFRDGVAGTNRSHFHGTFKTSKLGLSIDLKNEGGVRVAKRLVQWADVVLDSFTPGAMSRLGLGPEQVSEVNRSAITVTTSLLGGGGPFSAMAGYGYHAAAIAGFFDLVGWEDHPPDGPWLAYTDTICPRFITPSILAALDRRRRTGEGCHIEAAQLEIALQMLLPELLDYELDGAVAARMGNRAPDVAPQGVYPCAGEDTWIAISITDDDAWDRFRAVLGNPAWSQGAVLGTVDGRRANQNAVDTGIVAWTSQHSEADAERILRQAGIAAGVPQRSSDLLADPQYNHRDFYRTLDHEELGPLPYAGHQYRIEGYDNGPRTAAPTLGQHTFDILTELLGYDVDEVAEIAGTGCLE